MQFGQLRRRGFITLLGGAAAGPFAARAQQSGKLPIIGYLGANTPAAQIQWTAAFVQGLRDLGWIEGRNVMIEYRWAAGRTERYAEIATEFVRLRVDVIFTHGTPATVQARQMTSVIPVVFTVVGDPLGTGLVASLARPGGNLTGQSIMVSDLAAKRLELLRGVVPRLGRLGILGNVDNPSVVLEMDEVQATARKLGLQVARFGIRRVEDIAPAFEALKGAVEALHISGDPLVLTNGIRINTLAVGARLPTMNIAKEYVQAGGLMSYGPNYPDLYRRAAGHVDKILRGVKPADIPVEQPTKFDLVINQTTAKALELTIPESFLLRADEVIE
jgi:putative tryptophan/tyrosine transport system substrate-binding protein